MAINGPAGVIGLRGIGTFGTDYRPTNYRELYTLLEPNGTAPLNALLSMAASEATDDPKFNIFQDELPDRVCVIDNGAGYNNAATSLNVTAASQVGYVITGTILVNPRTGEIMQASADGSGTTLTVTRNIGGTSFSIVDTDSLIVAGFAATDGADVPGAISFDPTVVYNYTQIFRTSFKLTGSMQNTYFRTGNKEDEYTTKALKLHMSDIERAFIWGKRHEANGATAQPTRYTGGIMTTLTNVIDVDSESTPGVMSEDTFDSYLINTVFAFGSKQKVAFGGAKVAASLQKMGKDRWQPSVVGNTYGVNITRYTTFAGDLMFHLHPQFRQMPTMDEALLVLDLPYLKYRFLKNRDTQLLRNRQGNGVDAVQHEFLTECGLEFAQNKVHTIFKNWASIA